MIGTMPSKNVVKQYDSPAYYHVYNRGAGGGRIFVDDTDREKFLSILARHLVEPEDETEERYPIYDVEVVAYCLMGNHFHFLLYQEGDRMEIMHLMKSLSTAYVRYFNRRHRSRGHLFQQVFRASRISDDAYLAHISRYIHLNPVHYHTYPWSSLPEYLGGREREWVHPERVLDVSPQEYRKFLEDYEDRAKLVKSFDDEIAF